MRDRFTFHPRLYLGEGINEKKVDKMKKMLISKPLLVNVYLMVPAVNPADQIDIFDARQLVQPFYKNKSFYVVGMATCYEEALEVVEQMVQDCLRERGDCKLREYLLC